MARTTRCLALLLALGTTFASSSSSRTESVTLLPATAQQILEEVRRPGASVVVLNVWATWCPPCKEEFPDLLHLRRAYADRGLRLVLVSADFASERSEVVRFLADHGVDFPSYLKEGDDMEFIDTLHKRWSGAMPATFVYDSSGKLSDFKEGKASYETLEREVRDALAKHTTPVEGKEPS